MNKYNLYNILLDSAYQIYLYNKLIIAKTHVQKFHSCVIYDKI